MGLLIPASVVVIVALIAASVLVARNWQARPRSGDSRIECSLRLVEGQLPGATPRRWRAGTATLDRGTLVFQRGWPGGRGARPGSPPLRLSDLVIDAESRRPHGLELWSVNSRCEVFTIRTGDVTMEWSVLKAQAQWALQRLRS